MIFLDHHSTTPCHKDILKLMMDLDSVFFANPDSKHALGLKSQAIYNKALQSLKKTMFNDIDSDVFMTPGATYAINFFHLGLLEYCLKHSKTIVSTTVEHKATHKVLEVMQQKGVDVEYLKVNSKGRVDLEQLQNILSQKEVACISMIHANNEIGTLQDIDALYGLIKNTDIKLHLDMSQSLLQNQLQDIAQKVDAVTLSGHKIYGPKGVGMLILFAGKNKSKIKLKPILWAAQSHAMQIGTIPLSMHIAMVETLLKVQNRDFQTQFKEHCAQLKNVFFEHFNQKMQKFKISYGFELNWQQNGDLDNILNHNIHLSFAGISNAFIQNLKNICVSSGSTCSSDKQSASHVLKAIGLSDALAKNSIRIGLGLNNTENDMKIAAEDITLAAYKAAAKEK